MTRSGDGAPGLAEVTAAPPEHTAAPTTPGQVHAHSESDRHVERSPGAVDTSDTKRSVGFINKGEEARRYGAPAQRARGSVKRRMKTKLTLRRA